MDAVRVTGRAAGRKPYNRGTFRVTIRVNSVGGVAPLRQTCAGRPAASSGGRWLPRRRRCGPRDRQVRPAHHACHPGPAPPQQPAPSRGLLRSRESTPRPRGLRLRRTAAAPVAMWAGAASSDGVGGNEMAAHGGMRRGARLLHSRDAFRLFWQPSRISPRPPATSRCAPAPGQGRRGIPSTRQAGAGAAARRSITAS